VTPWIDGTTLYITGDQPGEYIVEVYATVGGAEGMVEVPVTVYETSALATADVSIHNVVEGQVARNTKQLFEFIWKIIINITGVIRTAPFTFWANLFVGCIIRT
jgi:uncharacterized membrane protein